MLQGWCHVSIRLPLPVAEKPLGHSLTVFYAFPVGKGEVCKWSQFWTCSLESLSSPGFSLVPRGPESGLLERQAAGAVLLRCLGLQGTGPEMRRAFMFNDPVQLGAAFILPHVLQCSSTPAASHTGGPVGEGLMEQQVLPLSQHLPPSPPRGSCVEMAPSFQPEVTVWLRKVEGAWVAGLCW